MKHTVSITVLLLSFFVLAQVFGLFLIMKDAQVSTVVEGNTTITTVVHDDTAVGARPDTKGVESLIYVVIGVVIGTLLVLLLAKFGKTNIWKVWYFIAVWMSISIALGVLIQYKLFFAYGLAIGIALALAIWKMFWPNIFIHNITEVLIYSGIALLLVPLFTVMWAIILLVLISLYDMYAVWKSKHMITMAKFQTKSNVFAGLMIPYRKKSGSKDESKTDSSSKTNDSLKTGSSKISASSSKSLKLSPLAKTATSGTKKSTPQMAILGGGDIAFPLIFTGAVFEGMLRMGLDKSTAYMHSSIIILTTTIALGLLFFYAKKGQFYPAMPFVSAGCLVGWGITLLI